MRLYYTCLLNVNVAIETTESQIFYQRLPKIIGTY